METIAQSAGEFRLRYVVCPECHYYASAENARTMIEPFSGIVLGYMLTCEHCDKKSFINLLGKPFLFDLSGRYGFNRGE
jgi:hypothetical protein